MAYAVPIVGTISFSDGFDVVPSPPDLTCVVDCGTGFYDVSNVVNSYAAGSATGAFVGTTSATSSDVDANALPFDIFDTDSGFTFTVTNFTRVGNSSLSCAGALCTEASQSGSWSASVVATGRPVVVPEPASLAVLGLGLLAFGAARRRMA